jgi:hypothetical protein
MRERKERRDWHKRDFEFTRSHPLPALFPLFLPSFFCFSSLFKLLTYVPFIVGHSLS